VGLLSRWSKVQTPSEAETHRSPVESGDVSRLLPNDGAMSCGAHLSAKGSPIGTFRWRSAHR